jgi:hypothetical protein
MSLLRPSTEPPNHQGIWPSKPDDPAGAEDASTAGALVPGCPGSSTTPTVGTHPSDKQTAPEGAVRPSGGPLPQDRIVDADSPNGIASNRRRLSYTSEALLRSPPTHRTNVRSGKCRPARLVSRFFIFNNTSFSWKYDFSYFNVVTFPIHVSTQSIFCLLINVLNVALVFIRGFLGTPFKESASAEASTSPCGTGTINARLFSWHASP